LIVTFLIVDDNIIHATVYKISVIAEWQMVEQCREHKTA